MYRVVADRGIHAAALSHGDTRAARIFTRCAEALYPGIPSSWLKELDQTKTSRLVSQVLFVVHVMTNRRKKFLTFLLPFASVLFVMLLGETSVRLWHLWRWNMPILEDGPRPAGGPTPITLDSELGWRSTENYQFDGTKRDAAGAEYDVEIRQNENGFRMFGDTRSSKPKVFVIGDSFTQANTVSDHKTYYAILKKELDIEVFAYGAGGYGSLQEFMILDRYFDVIKPDLVLWQFATNDLINNSPTLEMASSINNNGLVRPYLVDGQIQYILPREHTRNPRLFALKYCRLCYMLFDRIDRLRAATSRTVETETSAGKSAHPEFLKSVEVTEAIMDKVVARTGSVSIASFIVYGPGYEEYQQALEQVSRKHRFVLLPDIKKGTLVAKEGKTVFAADGSHWNNEGHRLVGKTLAAGFRSACLLHLCP